MSPRDSEKSCGCLLVRDREDRANAGRVNGKINGLVDGQYPYKGPEYPPTILIADDDDDIRESLVDIIHTAGWHAVAARDGEEALSRVQAEEPHAVVIDYRMPGMNGAEVIRALREQKVEIPVVLITAAGDIEELAREAGVRCFLCKPFGIDELIAVLRRALWEGGC
jgi:DNA-binding response OmpR family regulator